MCEAQWSTLLTSKPRRRRLRLLSETRCSALHIQGRDPRTPSGGEGRVQRRGLLPRHQGPSTSAGEPSTYPPGSGAAHRLGRNSQRLPSARGLSLVPSSPAVSSCSPQLSHLWGDAWGHWRTAGSHPLHKLGSWGWGSWEPLRSQLLRGGVRFTISRCSLVTRVQFQLQNLRFICVLFSSFHGNPHGSQSSAQEEWLAAPSSPASCQAFREERGGPETGPASGSAGRGRGPQGSRSAQGLRASLAWRGAIFPITGQQTEAQGKALAPSPTGWQD